MGEGESIGRIGSYDFPEVAWMVDGWSVSPESQWLSKFVMFAAFVFEKEKGERDMMLAVSRALSGNVKRFRQDASAAYNSLENARAEISVSTPGQLGESLMLASEADYEAYVDEKGTLARRSAEMACGLDPKDIG